MMRSADDRPHAARPAGRRSVGYLFAPVTMARAVDVLDGRAERLARPPAR